ncbi:phospholipase [Actinoplanes auranticolor]|uniref:Phospholipase A2-like protein n=1 Tax=Actinoplanes auranticolor TaxID=47988 RepID=A0A919VU75_9ACTN|nr:phospholipase [Actinoplanes auranticolor]GIM79089.1 hypothetical protein Aau02nite_84050 [Actinoplanes auranticolor]
MRSVVRGLTVAVLASLGLVTAQSDAVAAVPADKPAVLSGWTQTDAGSYHRWDSARRDQAAWAAYAFDWTTDYCSYSPDNPLGFDFTLACQRHDFGYRNYRAAGQFDANKARVDSAFYQDLLRKCDTYSAVVRPACDGLAWTYYEAVSRLGVLKVTQAQLDEAQRVKDASERAVSLR